MALPTWVAAGTEAAGTGDVTPGLPLGWAENDIFLLLVETAQEFVAEPTDYDVVADSPQGGGTGGGVNSTRLDMFWKRATSSESAPTITDPGNHAIAQIHAFRGCVTTGEPWDVTSGLMTTTAATSHTIPGDTTTVADCLVVLAGTSATDATTPRFSAWANADLANINERGDVSTDAGNGGGLGLATGEKATAGAYGTTSFTLASSSFSGKMTVALKPASGTTFNITPSGTITSAGVMVKGTNKGLSGTVPSSGAAMKAVAKPLAGTVVSVGALIKNIAKPFTGTVTSSGALETMKVVLLNLAGTISSVGTLVKDTSKGLAGSLAPSGIVAKAISKPFSGTVTSAGSLVSSVIEILRRWLFTPPTHEVVAWETGRDDKNRRADPTWRHYDRGDRGKTVVRTNGVYATYVNPLYTVLENADDIRLPDGTIGKAVFLGGHITEVTKAIKDELIAAGYSVESEFVA